VITEEQIAAAVKRYQDAREAAGLSRLIDDEGTLRLVAAVIASSLERQAK
jgi:hypothetical protein